MKINLKKYVYDVVNGMSKVTKNGISIKTVKLTPSLSTLDLFLTQTNYGMILL